MRLDNLTFKGGVHIKDKKELTKDKAVEKAREPEVVYIPLHQHVGAPCKALVKAKDTVKVGQKIGDSDASLTAPVHSSVSGIVKGIEKLYTHDGYKVDCVVIESDGLNEIHESVKPKGSIEDLTKEEIVQIIREAGVVGMGGAAFPMYSKLASAEDSKIDTVILNGAECEPYLTSDHRMMLEKPELVITGLELIMKCFNAKNGYIGVEDNKKDAIESLNNAIKNKDKMKVVSLKTKFPQGDSNRVVDSICNRVVPEGGRCKDVNTIVNNVCTAAAAAEAVLQGKPLYERIVTVSGNGIKEPKNLLVKIGTTIGDILEQCGGFNGKPGKVIVGGPMTGFTQFTLDTPISKGVTGIVVLTEEETKVEKVLPCIKCGKCVTVCPVHLEPLFIAANALHDRFDVAENLHALSCIGCGSCSYVCPSKRPLTEAIVHAKKEITLKNKKS
ncbi:electron transport complex subunit RsxC [Tissierellaceae bacterium HCP3S3_D8]